ncbi:Crp/Fnr family transcriptional regulator [Streptomyces cyaneofuscatus]|uniref:Crp/Fnr family transcriptional regulator n=1 Tax=Streptomyces cyaneofuscatus TaxID=66883 RepID=UPI0036762919
MNTAPDGPYLLSEHVALLRDNGRREAKPAGVLMQEGSPSDHLLLIERGLVKITSAGRDGSSKLLAFRGVGDLVGDFGCIDGAPRSASVVALVPVIAWVVPATRFQRLLHHHEVLSQAVLRLTVERVRESDRKLSALGEASASERVIRLLADLAVSLVGDAGSTSTRVSVPVTHHELGTSAGVSRATVARALRDLKLAGIAEQRRGSIQVTNLPGLTKAAG